MYDIAIIGLGPAGASLARLLDKRLHVIAFDKKGDNSKFHKPCGGLLAPDAQKALARFQLTLPLDVLVHPQIFSVRTLDIGTRQLRHYQRYYLNLDRDKFDAWLKACIPAHITQKNNAVCTAISACPGGYSITYTQEGSDYTVQAKAVVGADGAASLVRKACFPKATIRRYTAVQQWFVDKHETPFYSCIFDRKTTDCYAWGLSKEGHFLFGGAFPPKGARKAFEQLKEKMRPYGFALDAPVKTQACQVLRPRGPFDIHCGKGQLFLVGEAAGFISPSSLEGISYALNSAYALSTVLNSGHAARQYVLKTLSIRLRLALKSLKSPFMYWPPLRFLVMKSGLQAIDVLPQKKEPVNGAPA